jgi:hypothetical protein
LKLIVLVVIFQAKTINNVARTRVSCTLKFFYQGLEHKGVQLPAAINFAHYTHGTGQVRSNAFINSPWQLREFIKFVFLALAVLSLALESD